MTKQTRKYSSLSRRIVWLFCLFTLLLSGVFSLISFTLMYTIEDRFIEKDIEREAQFLASEYANSGQWPSSVSHNYQLHFSKNTFPEDIRETAIAEPQRKEFFGREGRHYHLYRYPDHQSVFLIAEVSEDLMVRHIRDRVIKFLVVSTLIIATIACLLAWLLGTRTTRPLKKLAALVSRVAPESIPQNFSQQFPNNEVGVLANTLEHTLQRLEHALVREQSFTRDASHELRTPLAVIKNAVELARTQPQSTPENQSLYNQIFNAADQMQTTVNTLLMLAREEHLATKSMIKLMPIVEQSIIDNCILLKGKSIDVEVSDSCNVDVFAESNLLKLLIDNLLSNAFKFTEEGRVSIGYFNGQLCIQDSGPGIAKNLSEKITGLGVKGEQSTGFGFGLSIVKRLCEHQGWKMTVQSEKGTTVAITLS